MKETRPIIYCGGDDYNDVHHYCESIVGGNSKGQQWPSINTIVDLLECLRKTFYTPK